MASKRHNRGPVQYLWAIGQAPIDKIETLVLTMMLCRADYETGEFFQSLPRLAALCKMHVDGVRRVVRRLEERGMLEPIHRSNGGPGRTSRYRIRLDHLGPSSPDRESGLNPDRWSDNPRPRPTETQTGELANPDRGQGEPTKRSNMYSTSPSLAAAAVERLVDAGVNRVEAEELITLTHLDQDQIDFVLRESQKPSIHLRSRFIAAKLRTSPAELDGFEQFRRSRLQHRERQLVRAFEVAAEEANRVGRNEEFARCLGTARSVWPSARAVIEAGFLDNRILNDPAKHGGIIAHRVFAMADELVGTCTNASHDLYSGYAGAETRESDPARGDRARSRESVCTGSADGNLRGDTEPICDEGTSTAA